MAKILGDTRLLRVIRATIELVVLAVAFASAFAYRFELPLESNRAHDLLVLIGPVVVVELLALRLAGAHRHSWRYTGLHDVGDVVLALTGATAVLLAVRAVPATPGMVTVSLGVILANWIAATAAVCGVRVLRRLQSERAEARRCQTGKPGRTPMLLIGAGRAGVMVAQELNKRPDLGIVAAGFVDDDPAKAGRRIAGVDVVGTSDKLDELARTAGVREVIITMASVTRADMRRILAVCKAAELATKIIPGLFEIVGGRVDLNRIRPVAVEDLLGREPVELDQASLRGLVGDKVVMVTGAGGSIGAELARQAARFGPAHLVLVERSEPALWRIDRELRRDHPHLTVDACIADVTDRPRMRHLFASLHPDVVVHAAAHKHVPIMETHPGEAVKNNVGGTRVVADLAVDFAVGQFVLVSTDKAVNPTSVMGATKRLTERYVQHLAHTTGLHAVAVRFGNVLGSDGSVVPIFQEQVRAGGPVTVTHPDMVRYFMTIPEAAGLVLQAAALGESGEILVLDMGEAVRIVDLAENVIRLSGFEPDVDIAIEFTGLRPGEKLFEELNLTGECAERTRHPKVWVGHNPVPTWETVQTDLQALRCAADTSRPEDVRALLAWIVPEYASNGQPSVPVAAEVEPAVT